MATPPLHSASSSTHSSPDLSAKQLSQKDMDIVLTELALARVSGTQLTAEETQARIIRALPPGLSLERQLEVADALMTKYLARVKANKPN